MRKLTKLLRDLTLLAVGLEGLIAVLEKIAGHFFN
jgi:hypothetical protein